jgi:hypothetical protein
MSARPPEHTRVRQEPFRQGRQAGQGRRHPERGNVHSTIRGECPHAHVMMGHDHRIDTDLHRGVRGR